MKYVINTVPGVRGMRVYRDLPRIVVPGDVLDIRHSGHKVGVFMAVTANDPHRLGKCDICALNKAEECVPCAYRAVTPLGYEPPCSGIGRGVIFKSVDMIVEEL